MVETVSPKEEETDKGKENDTSKYLPHKERIADLSQPVLSKSAMMTSLPKLNLPVFDEDPCVWPNWYGMFKALVHDQRLSKTQKTIYLKASVKGTAKKVIAGMFFGGTMYEKAIAELIQRFGNPTLISKSLINKFLEIPAIQDENTSSFRLFVDNLHNIVRTLKTYSHEADLQAAANMQQIFTKLLPKIDVRWSNSSNQTPMFFAACEACITSRRTVIDYSERRGTMASVEHKDFSLVTVQHQLV